MKTKLIFFGIVLITLILYLPSFNVFYTNDDFFLLKISQANNISEFMNFFNFTKGPDGLGMYRPLTIQVFYFLAHSLFNLNPFPMHVVVFIVFTLLLYSIFLLSRKLFGYLKVKNKDNPSLLVVFLYAMSATHFGHMYYLATFQEVAMTLFSVVCIYYYLNFLDNKNITSIFLSFMMFVLALLSKENAVVIPGLLFSTYLFRQIAVKDKIVLVNVVKQLAPFAILLSIYLYFHFFVYGLATGDSYVWDFSIRKILNTLSWYLLWSFNIPEMFVDFVGPGLKINPNLMKYWADETTAIVLGFLIIVLTMGIVFIKTKTSKQLLSLLLFSGMGFVVSLVPVLFLPIHKFTFYLTLPLVFITMNVAYLLIERNKLLVYVFVVSWLFTSYNTLCLTNKTHWITRGQEIAQEVNKFITTNILEFEGKSLVFVDTQEDEPLPWSPTEIVKTALSNQNYFDVYFPKQFITITYSETSNEIIPNAIHSRQFLGY